MSDAVDSSNPTSEQPPVADLGILLVHGIGEQAQAETLTKFAEPIVDWMRDWLQRESGEGSLVASTAIDGVLRPPLLPPGTPAHARVLVGAGRDDNVQVQQWLFTEAWWNPQVLTPSITGFALWLATRGPWLLLFHLNQGVLASPRVSNWWKWLIGIPITAVWVLSSLLFSILLVAGALLGAIPIGRLRSVVYAGLRRVTGVVGDAYVLLRSPVQRVAFEHATLDALQWLRPRCRRMAVVAHSQGAAIAHGALQRDDVPATDLLITVGSGITKLEALRRLERLGASDRLAGFLAPLLLVAAVVVGLRSRALGLSGESTLGLPAALGLLGLALVAQVWLTVRQALKSLRDRSHRLSLTETQPTLHWVDIVATHDPVPAGELRRFFDLPEIESLSIPVLRSRLADHTGYWNARASFMQVLVPRLAQCASLLPGSASDQAASAGLEAAHRQLVSDLRVLGAGRLFNTVALLLPFAIARDRLIANVSGLRALLAPHPGPDGDASPLAFVDDAIGKVEQALRWTTQVVAGDPAAWVRPTVNLAVALLLAGAALLAWQRLEFAVWSAWSAGRNQKALRPPTTPLKLPAQARLFMLFNASLVNAAVAVVLLLPVSVSVAWSMVPGWVDEAHVYWLLGETAGALFVVGMMLGLVGDMAESFDGVLERWRRWRADHAAWSWSGFQATASRLIAGGTTLCIVWYLLDSVLTLPSALKFDVISILIAAMLGGLLKLLDHIWRQLDKAGANVWLKTTLLSLPLTVGVIGTTVLPRQADFSRSGLAGAALVISWVVAGLTILALRPMRARR